MSRKPAANAPPPKTETLLFKCQCGQHHRMTLAHYEERTAACGRRYWALQPRKYGPLKAFEMPEKVIMKKEYGDSDTIRA